ncbi:hypothetical protein [Paenibacillus jamilae]|uniref:hypothetical protein n=1 Tax=Paenibacillus jamilae TaxID=114136 RepID=UPI000A5D82DA|nr:MULTISPECIES: hypothetical protein [Paenibacillus]
MAQSRDGMAHTKWMFEATIRKYIQEQENQRLIASEQTTRLTGGYDLKTYLQHL